MTGEVEMRQSHAKVHGSRVGQVESIPGDKTILVHVGNLVKHPRYGKYVRHRTKLSVHDENSKAKVGDLVEIIPCRPMSKTKAHRLLRIVRAAEGENV